MNVRKFSFLLKQTAITALQGDAIQATKINKKKSWSVKVRKSVGPKMNITYKMSTRVRQGLNPRLDIAYCQFSGDLGSFVFLFLMLWPIWKFLFKEYDTSNKDDNTVHARNITIQHFFFGWKAYKNGHVFSISLFSNVSFQ